MFESMAKTVSISFWTLAGDLGGSTSAANQHSSTLKLPSWKSSRGLVVYLLYQYEFLILLLIVLRSAGPMLHS